MATQQEIDRQYTTTLMIVGALITGQVLFAAIAWFLHRNGSLTPSGAPLMNPITYAWIFFALGGFSASLFLRQRLSALGTSPKGQQLMRSGAFTPMQLQSQVIVMFAFIEGAGLLGIANYFLTGHSQLLLAALAYLAIAVALFLPRREWFDAFRQV